MYSTYSELPCLPFFMIADVSLRQKWRLPRDAPAIGCWYRWLLHSRPARFAAIFSHVMSRSPRICLGQVRICYALELITSSELDIVSICIFMSNNANFIECREMCVCLDHGLNYMFWLSSTSVRQYYHFESQMGIAPQNNARFIQQNSTNALSYLSSL